MTVRAWIGLGLVLLLIAAALLGPLLVRADPEQLELGQRLSAPSRTHLLGQDKLGRDVLARVLIGARVSLAVGLIVVLVSALVGSLLGGLAGFLGGVFDGALMRLVDVLMAFPGILLAIAIAGILGPSVTNVIIALSALGWVGYARLVRGQVMAVRERDFVIAARATGVPESRVLWRHVAPVVLAPVIVQASFGIAGAVLAESSLSFLGLGPQDMPSWGAMISEGAEQLRKAPHLATFPGLAIALTVLAFNFLGDGLRDRLDPQGAAQ
ncbi:MAG: ABC transporter permease [Candidatus Alcyoniella australis]|nr:ABC transporter permease [Candidatus Alcyoniella australis]